MKKIKMKIAQKMSNVTVTRESDMLSSENTSFLYTEENEKERFAKQLLDGVGKKITTTRSIKYKKPLKLKIKEIIRALFKIDKKELEEKLNEIEMDMINYKIQ